jgi:hypothetical protein
MRNEGNVLAPMRPQDASIQLVVQPRDLIVTFFGDHEHVRATVNDIRHGNRRSNDERDRPMAKCRSRDLVSDVVW